jgi:hypothetical protein
MFTGFAWSERKEAAAGGPAAIVQREQALA